MPCNATSHIPHLQIISSNVPNDKMHLLTLAADTMWAYQFHRLHMWANILETLCYQGTASYLDIYNICSLNNDTFLCLYIYFFKNKTQLSIQMPIGSFV